MENNRSGICEGRVVAITGAGRGVGRSYALEFARHGAKVVVNDLGSAVDGSGFSTTPADEVVEEIRAAGGSAIADHHDISRWEAAAALIESAIREFGQLDVLVNNAGILRDRTITNMSESEWDDVIRVHLKGTMATTRAAAEHWRNRSKAGEVTAARLINTSSSSGLFGAAGQGNYAAAKAGVAALTIVASRELARYGVTANAIYPTASSRLTVDQFKGSGVVDESGRLAVERARLDPSNIAPVVVWLGSVESGHINGRVIGVRENRIAFAEGWHMGATFISDEPFDARTVGTHLSALDARTPANALTNGTIPEKEG